MRFSGIALMGTIVLAACGGEKAAETKPATDAPAASPAPAAAAPAAAAAGAVAAAPITGKTIEVKMVGDDKGYRFEPADIKLKAGDGIKFVVVSMGPHNVAFDAASAGDQKAQLDANMGPDKMAELSSAMKMNPGDFLLVSFANIKPGVYHFNCTPHLAMNMKGTVTVQ
jgi:plastocyanin